MSIGSNIKKYRDNLGLTQEKLAEELGVTFQAVSSWERDEYMPELGNLLKLTEVFKVSLSSIVSDRVADFETRETLFDWEHMKTFVKTTARNYGLHESLRALDFAVEKHEDEKRKNSDVPYIYHPLNLACHAISMGIIDDEVIAACLLHDVVEDTETTVDELPVNDSIRELVRLLTRFKNPDEPRNVSLDNYYGGIMGNDKAILVKCIDRCNNLTTMSWGLSFEKQVRYIVETEHYFPDLFRKLKAVPEYSSACWLLRYQMESMLDIYKRLL